MIIWLTGQPGSGKTTLAKEFIERIKKDTNSIKIINLDGDDLRSINKIKIIQRKVELKIFQQPYQ